MSSLDYALAFADFRSQNPEGSPTANKASQLETIAALESYVESRRKWVKSELDTIASIVRSVALKCSGND